MDYYVKTLADIRKLVSEGDHDEALKLIEDEFKAPYMPEDFKNELISIKKEIEPEKASFSLSEDLISDYLKGSKEMQLLAVDRLDKMNLREHIGLCNEYLCSDGYINAKVLLVDSLIRQEIGEEIKMTDEGMEYEFIPKYQLPAAESDAYISGSRYLNETFMKEPSKLRIALDLLYKELMLSLPVNMDEDEGVALSRDIVAYVNRAFGDED